MNDRLRKALIGAIIGGGALSGLTLGRGIANSESSADEYIPNALRFGLIGAVPGAALGAILGNPEPPKEQRNNKNQLYFTYPPSLQSMYANYTHPRDWT